MFSAVYATDQAAFMAGYVAAGMSQTGVVGTFGGINIPPVTAFMDGFYYGVDYHSQKGTNVQVLGWNPASKDGLFTGTWRASTMDAPSPRTSMTKAPTS